MLCRPVLLNENNRIVGGDTCLLAKNNYGNIWKRILIFIDYFTGNVR